MENKENIKKVTAGLFFVGGIFLIFWFILVIGKNKGFAEPKFQVSVIFKDVGGLAVGAPVRLSGVSIGTVDNIDFLDQDISGRKVRVKINVFSKFRKQFEASTQFSIKTEGVLGEKLLEVEALPHGPRIDLTQPIIGEDPFDLGDLAQSFTAAARSFTKTSRELSQIDMVELAQVMADSSRSLLVTSEGINEILDELQEIANKSKRLFDRIEQKLIEGSLFKVF